VYNLPHPPPMASTTVEAPRPGLRHSPRFRRAALALAALYPLALLTLILAFRLVGERWWVVTVALYLPRIFFLLPLPVALGLLLYVGSRREFWIVLGTSFVLFTVLMGFVVPWPGRGAARDPDAPSFRIMSFNIDSQHAGTDRVVAEIDAYAPDIVFLVESGDTDKIEPMMRARFANVTVSGQFVAASKFPIVSTVDPEKLPFYGRLRSPRWLEHTIDTPVGRIAFYEVHPLSPRDGFNALRGDGLRHEILSGQGFSASSERAVKMNAGLRTAQVTELATTASAETGPVLIAGDTNLPGLSWLLGTRLGRFHDGFDQAGSGLGYTFPTRFPWMRIDRMLANDELRFTHFEVGHSRASDHECIVADVQRAR
jgi:vancomycin resistance protein VanJ